MADSCRYCGASKRFGTLRDSDHNGGCNRPGQVAGRGKGLRVARNDNVEGGHVHSYAQTGNSHTTRVKRGRKYYLLTIYEQACPVAGCPKPVIWSEPHEQEELATGMVRRTRAGGPGGPR